jgi:hypothetical protein
MTAEKDWVKKFMPIIAISLAVLLGALMAGRVIGIPFIPEMEMQNFQKLMNSATGTNTDNLVMEQIVGVKTMMADLQKRDNSTESLLGEISDSRSLISQGKTPAPVSSQVKKATESAYQAFEAFLLNSDPKKQFFGLEKVASKANGAVDWVAPANKGAWLQIQATSAVSKQGERRARVEAIPPHGRESYQQVQKVIEAAKTDEEKVAAASAGRLALQCGLSAKQKRALSRDLHQLCEANEQSAEKALFDLLVDGADPDLYLDDLGESALHVA